jgi:hypothetical protein
LALVSYFANTERVNLIFLTFHGLFEFFVSGNDAFFNSIDVGEGGGFYAASPLTWIAEFGLIFNNSIEVLFPSKTYFPVDSGPAYIILNSGLLLAIIFYFLFYLFIRSSGVHSLFLILIILISDLKFRSAFSLFPMFWIYLNSAYLTHGVGLSRR